MFLELRRRINDVGRPKNKKHKKKIGTSYLQQYDKFHEGHYFKGKHTKKGTGEREKRNIKHILIGFGHIFRPYYKYYLNIFAYIREKT